MTRVKRLLNAGLILAFAGVVLAQQQPMTAEEIRREMTRIRRSTNWEDPRAAEEATNKILELSRQLSQPDRGSAPSQPAGGQPADQAETSPPQEDITPRIDRGMMWQAILRASESEVLLATEVRDQIVQEYKDEESARRGNAASLEEVEVLIIDFSRPESAETVANLESYKSVKILVLTGGKRPGPVEIDSIIARCLAMPLEELYIINFGKYVSHVPESIGRYTALKLLALFNNGLAGLPSSVSLLRELTKLHVDLNPLLTVAREVNGLAKLEELGLVKTRIPESEVERIQHTLPNCEVLYP
jgi:hypothetical protein